MSTQQQQLEISAIKKLLYDNRLLVDNELKIVNKSDAQIFKLLIHSKVFDPKDFTVKTVGNTLIVEAHIEEKEMDDKTMVRQNMAYEHELPDDIDPKTVKAFFPVMGFLEIEAPRILKF